MQGRGNSTDALVVSSPSADDGPNGQVALLHRVLDGTVHAIIACSVVSPTAAGDDGDFEFRFANEAAALLVHRPVETLIGQRMRAVFPGSGDNGMFAKYWTAWSTGIPMDEEMFYPDDGLGAWFHIHATPQPDGLIISFSNITRQHGQQQALQEREAVLREAQNLAQVGTWTLDPVTQAVTWSDQMYHITGVNPAEPPPPPAAHDGFFAPESRQAYQTAMREAVRRGTPFNLDLQIVTADGRRIHVHVMGRAEISPTTRTVVRLHGTMQDVSELMETNQRLKKALDDLQATQHSVVQQERLRALGEMASGIAHDFNNQLTIILGMTELLLNSSQRRANSATLESFLKNIHRAGTDAANIVSRLREFYRFREPAESFEPLSLNDLIRECVALTEPRWRGQAQARGSTVAIELDLDELPEFLGNPVELRETLTNLMLNAVDAIGVQGVITIRTRHKGDIVMLQICDTGKGMESDVLERCLDPFFTTKADGTGLGLSMVYGIVGRHRGTMDVQSTVGVGTTFTLNLPMNPMPQPVSAEGKGNAVNGAIDANAPAPAPASPSPAAVGEATPKPVAAPVADASPDGKRVLLVDDDPFVLMLLQEFLEIDGHKVDGMECAADALKKLDQQDYDIIISDHSMPGVSGVQFAAAAAERPVRIPFVLLTGFGQSMCDEERQLPGIDCVLCKPVALDELRAAISQFFAS